MSNLDNIDLSQMAQMFKALSHPKRLEIFLDFASCIPPGTVEKTTEEQMAVCQREISAVHELAPSTVSHHIKELRISGLIHQERRGKEIFISVNPEALETLHFFTRNLGCKTNWKE